MRFALGHKRTNHPRPNSTNVRCYSNSGQTRVRQDCPLSAKSGLMHCNMITAKRKTASRRSLQSPIRGACGASPNRVCLIRRLRWQQPSASCASRADPTRRGRWRREGGRQGRPVGFVSESNSNSGRATSVHHQPFLTRSPHTR